MRVKKATSVVSSVPVFNSSEEAGLSQLLSTMSPRVVKSFVLFSVFSLSQATIQDFVRFENDPGDAVKAKQPLLLADRGGRFLRFDTKDTEIELELGVAVPFLKIPLAASAGAEGGAPPDHRVSVNPAGLLVGATILFSSFLLIPWVLPTSSHSSHHQRRDESVGDGGRSGAWGLVREIEHLLISQNLDPRSCPQKAICILGQNFNSVVPSLFDAMLRFDSIKEVTESSGIANAIRGENCEAAYPTCMIDGNAMAVIPRMLGLSSA